MESVVIDCNGGGERVVTELSQVMELVRKLEGCLGGSHTQEECRRLASQISSLTERSIALITSYSLLDAGGRKRSAASLLSDASDAPFNKNTKKRRTTNKVKHHVRVSSAAGGGGGGDIPADDGHSWRKYGQKEILGAKYPRGYYRCTHRHSQGCAATKQVQRADDDPTLLDVVYLGEHTCVQNAPAAAGQAAATPTTAPEHNPNAHSLLQNLSSNLTVKTEGLAVAPAPEPPQGWVAAAGAPFCLPSTPASACLQAAAAAAELSPFSAPSTSENWGVSPATSDSNQHAAASFPPFEIVAGDDVQFEFGEVVSALADVPGELPGDDFDISCFFA